MLDAQGQTILDDESESEESEGEEEEEEMWLNLARLKDKMVLHSQDEEAQTGGEHWQQVIDIWVLRTGRASVE